MQHRQKPVRNTWLRLLIAVALVASGAMVANAGSAATDATITNYPMYTKGTDGGIDYTWSYPLDISTAGGNVWFADNGTGSIGKATPSGAITEYLVSVD